MLRLEYEKTGFANLLTRMATRTFWTPVIGRLRYGVPSITLTSICMSYWMDSRELLLAKNFSMHM
jgi:hypothetical protein